MKIENRQRLFYASILLSLVLGLGLLVWGWRAGVDFLEKWQATNMADLATRYAEEGKFEEAAMSAHTALRLDPLQPEASRFMAGLMEAEGRWEQAMELYGRLYHGGGGTLEDLKKQAVNAARGQYTDPARFLAGEVAKKGEPEFPLLLEAEIRLRNEDLAGAREAIRSAVILHKSRPAQAAMMRFLLAHPDKDENAELLKTIWKLKDGDDAIALEALSVGLASGLVPVESRAEFVAKLRAHPKRTERALLLADTAEVALDPASKPRVAGQIIARLKEGKFDDRLVGAMWLNAQGHPREALALNPPEDAISNPAAMRAWLDSAAALGEWNAMIGVLAREDVPLPPHMARVYTARALKMDDRAAEGDAAYRSALEEVRDKPLETAEVLEYLHRSGEYGIFDEGFKAGLEKPGEAFDMVARLVPVVLDARDSARMREVLEMALASPTLSKAAPLLNDAAYLDLVLGRPVDANALRERLKEFPGDSAVYFTLVLERLRNGNAREALAMVKQANPDVNTLPPNHLTVMACVLAANGRKEDALRTAARIPATRISTQELEMLRAALTSGTE
jgi:thioredoxin-like negative regulator of GroEL